MKLWLDDYRKIPFGYDLWAKNYDEAISCLTKGNIDHIDFDHDLAEEHYSGDFSKAKSGYDVAKWIEEKAYNGAINKMTWGIHSMNPSGAENIRKTMENADRYWRNHE